jgi:hypothetical protein
MLGITWSLKRYNFEQQTSEEFTTAGRSLKSGLVASSVVSTWTWAATLLQSTTVTYRYGIIGISEDMRAVANDSLIDTVSQAHCGTLEVLVFKSFFSPHLLSN